MTKRKMETNYVKKNEQGYSLIEMLLVLILLSTTLLISIPMFQRSINNNDINYFFEQLEKDLYESQFTAMSEGMMVRLIFSSTDKYYRIRHGVKTIKYQSFPKGLTVSKGSLDLNNLRFLPSGNLSNSGTIIFNYKNDTYVLVFQFLRGRFYIEK